MRIYRYVLANDVGMAPNPRGKFVSLATCKPAIRSVAQEGDWVVGNFPSHRNHCIAWAGKVSHVIPVADYSRRFPNRQDALYTIDSGGILVRIPEKLEWYHPTEEHQRKDKKGSILIFDRAACWYFGGDGRSLPGNLAHLAAYGQGHRVNRVKENDPELLEAWLRSEADPGHRGEPRDGWADKDQTSCNRRRRKKKKSSSC